MNDMRKKDRRAPETMRMDAHYGASFAHITDVMEHGEPDRKKEEMDRLLTMMTFQPTSTMFQSARRILHSLRENSLVPAEYEERVSVLAEKYPYKPTRMTRPHASKLRDTIAAIIARRKK